MSITLAVGVKAPAIVAGSQDQISVRDAKLNFGARQA